MAGIRNPTMNFDYGRPAGLTPAAFMFAGGVKEI